MKAQKSDPPKTAVSRGGMGMAYKVGLGVNCYWDHRLDVRGVGGRRGSIRSRDCCHGSWEWLPISLRGRSRRDG